MKKNTPEVFWSKVDRRGPEECWPWLGYRQPNGYGRVRFEGRYRSAHSGAWQLANGTRLPPGRKNPVCHHCDNPPCCNPAHLFRGTPAENTRDMMQKGRQVAPIGERCAQARMTWVLAREIRQRYATERISVAELARQYEFSLAAVSALLRGESWKEEGMVLADTRDRRRGSDLANARLLDADIPVIRAAYAAGESQRQIAARYGVSQCCIRGVVTGKTWRHVEFTA